MTFYRIIEWLKKFDQKEPKPFGVNAVRFLMHMLSLDVDDRVEVLLEQSFAEGQRHERAIKSLTADHVEKLESVRNEERERAATIVEKQGDSESAWKIRGRDSADQIAQSPGQSERSVKDDNNNVRRKRRPRNRGTRVS